MRNEQGVSGQREQSKIRQCLGGSEGMRKQRGRPHIDCAGGCMVCGELIQSLSFTQALTECMLQTHSFALRIVSAADALYLSVSLCDLHDLISNTKDPTLKTTQAHSEL